MLKGERGLENGCWARDLIRRYRYCDAARFTLESQRRATGRRHAGGEVRNTPTVRQGRDRSQPGCLVPSFLGNRSTKVVSRAPGSGPHMVKLRPGEGPRPI